MNQQGPFTKFEQELADAMRPVDPPQGFAERVMARAAAGEQPRARVLKMMPWHVRTWSSGAIAAALLVGAFVGQQVHVRREREKAELVQQQYETAMRITNETMAQVRDQLREAGVEVGN